MSDTTTPAREYRYEVGAVVYHLWDNFSGSEVPPTWLGRVERRGWDSRDGQPAYLICGVTYWEDELGDAEDVADID